MEESCPATPLVLTGRDSKSPLQVSVSSPESDEMKSPSRNSPDSHCVICLGRLQNKSFTDSCLHQFCFQCLLQWSKVKPECPLCKQPFKSIIHNVRSNFDYDQYHVGQPHCVLSDLVHTYNFDFIPVEGRFRYRSTMTREYFRELAETFLAHTRRMPDSDSYEIPPMMPVDPAPGINVRRSSRLSANSVPQRARQRGTSEFRRNIYIQDLWVEDLADVSGRYRTCTPQFYRDNPAQIHRIIPWLNREVNVLLNDCGSHAAYVLSQIVAILPLHPISSREFRELVAPYFGQRTDHFIHELNTFARSVYDIAGFDQNAVYAPNPNYATEVQEILSSSDNSDIEILETIESEVRKVKKHPKTRFKETLIKRAEENVNSEEPVAGPSGLNTARKSKSIDICESDSDDIKVLTYIKPEPEVVTLSSGDEVPVFSDLDLSDGEYAKTIKSGFTKVNYSSESADKESYERQKYKSKGGKGKCKSNGFGLKGKQKKNYMRLRKSRSRSNTSNESINSYGSSNRRHNRSRSRSSSSSSSSSKSSNSYSSSSSITSVSSTTSISSSSSSNHTSSSVDKNYPKRSKRTRSILSESRNYSECKLSSKLKKKKSKVSVLRKKSKKKIDSKPTISKAKRHRSCFDSDSDSDKKVKSKKKVKSCVVVPRVKPCDLSFSSLNSSKCNVSGISSRNSEESEPRKRSHTLTSYWSIALDAKNRDRSRNRRESPYHKKSIKSKRRSDKSSSEERSSRQSRNPHSSSESSNKSSCEREHSASKKGHNSWSDQDDRRKSPSICESVNGQNSPSTINSTTKTAFLATSSSSVSRSPAVSCSSEKPYFESD